MDIQFNDKFHLNLLNQIFEIEKKLKKSSAQTTIYRNIEKIKDYFSDIGLEYHDPTGEYYSDSRTDCDASISGQFTSNLSIVETIKPIIRYRKDGYTTIMQKAIVIVEGKGSSKQWS